MINLRQYKSCVSDSIRGPSFNLLRRNFRYSKHEYKRNMLNSLQSKKVVHRELRHKNENLESTHLHLFGYPYQPLDDNNFFSPYLGQAHT